MADLIFICFVALRMFFGYKKGFIKTVVGFASTLLSLFITSILYPILSKILYAAGCGDLVKSIVMNMLNGEGEMPYNEKLAEVSALVVINIISFILVIALSKVIISLIAKSLNLVGRLPVIKQANAILGMTTGLLSSLLISYIVIGVIGALSGSETVFSLQQSIRSSIFPSLMYFDNSITKLLLDLSA